MQADTLLSLANALAPVLDARGRCLFDARCWAALAEHLAPLYPQHAAAVRELTKAPRYPRSVRIDRDAEARSNINRAARILATLDDIMEEQAMMPGADRPAATREANRYHDNAGYFERRDLPHANALTPKAVASRLRYLASILAIHRGLLKGDS